LYRGFQLTTAGRVANKQHCAAILSVGGEFLCLLTRIFVDVTKRKEKKKKEMEKFREKEISKEK
jgi:hypothetical protein